MQAATQADAVDATCGLVAGGSGADAGDGRPSRGWRGTTARGTGGGPNARGVDAGGGAGGAITGGGELPSLSRCATMMASSWSRTWGGGSSISRLNLFHFRQSTESRVEIQLESGIQYEIRRENLQGLVVIPQ